MDKLNVALIGAGRMGSVHGPNAARHPLLKLKYIIDPRAEVAGAMASSLGAETATLDHALSDPDIGGILVCSSTDQHLEHALAAVKAGKAVFCEKPIDLDLGKAQAAERQFDGARLVLAFNRRFDPHFRALKARLDAGVVGQLESLHVTNHDPAAPPPGFIPTSGGLFKDFTVHDLDLARWLLGEEPVEVFAMASCLVDPEIERLGDVDTARTLLKTRSGKMCVISNTRRSGYGYDQRIEAFGSKGAVQAGNTTAATTTQLTEAGQTAEPIHPGFMSRYAAAYAAEIDHFAQVATGAAKSEVGYADGVAALILAEACAESVRTGQPVHL
ncbi:MAG: inositol 2-dehydrogenase [Brevundimonas sp.]|nr:MAG: inositol 2-dehydrogenase [Brevundimonas sp.]